jgi:toxin ParE1/3/4
VRHIKFADAAAEDLEEIYDFIAADNIQAADSVMERLQKRWQSLADKPGIGTKRDELQKGLRSITEGPILTEQCSPEFRHSIVTPLAYLGQFFSVD